LARLGDSFLNFVYSLAMTRWIGEPQGLKVSDRILADVAKKTGVRSMLPRRTARGEIANSIEALIVQAWLTGVITIDETVRLMEKQMEDPSEAIARVVVNILKKMNCT